MKPKDTSIDEKHKTPRYTIDFVTALPVAACYERLDRSVSMRPDSWAGWMTPVQQQTTILDDQMFVIERRYPGAIHPIRLVGHLDLDDDSEGTWVHGAVTHDTSNQVLIEGMIVFLAFFMLTALFFLRLKTRGIFVSLPLLLLALTIFSLRWQALRASTEDIARWVRRKLYVTPGQIKR